MKIITLNTWQGRFFRNFVPFFEREDADIICMQELNKTDGYIPTLHSLETWNDVKESTLLAHTYYSPTWSYDVMGRKAEFGNGLLSRFPITHKETIFTHGSYKKVTADNYETNVRNAQIVTLDTPQGVLTVVNHHAWWETDGMGSPTSKKKLEILVEKLKDINNPLIIVGDFNVWGKSEALLYLSKELHLRDLTEEYNLGSTLNELVTPYTVACDHIFVNSHIKVKNFAMSDELLSDHKALILDFDIK